MPRRTARRRDPNTLPARPTRPSKAGRPPAIASPALVDRLLEALAAGVDVKSACLYAGISTSAHGRAMDLGRQAQDLIDREDSDATLTERQEQYRAYREAVDRARAQVAVVNVALVGKAAAGGAVISEKTETWTDDDGVEHVVVTKEYARPVWQAARFMLQVSAQRDEYTTQQRRAVEVTGAGGGPVEVTPSAELVQGVLTRLDEVRARQAQELPGGWSPVEGSPYGDDEDHPVIEGDAPDDGWSDAGDEVPQYGDE